MDRRDTATCVGVTDTRTTSTGIHTTSTVTHTTSSMRPHVISTDTQSTTDTRTVRLDLTDDVSKMIMSTQEARHSSHTMDTRTRPVSRAPATLQRPSARPSTRPTLLSVVCVRQTQVSMATAV